MKYLLKILFFYFTIYSFSQTGPERELPLNFGNATPMLAIDLDKTPATKGKLYTTAFFDVLQIINTELLKKAFENKVTSLLKDIDTNIANNSGFLIKVTTLVDEFGNPFLPPNVLTPIGIGIDPVDSYANYINTPTVSIFFEPSKATKETTSFIWVYKEKEHLLIGEIPSVFKDRLIKDANKLARKYTKNASGFFNPFNSSNPNYEGRALYWYKKQVEFEKELKEKETYEKVKKLTSRFNELQLKQKYLSEKYESLKRELNNNNSLSNVLNAFVVIGSQFSDSDNSENENIKMTYDPKLIENHNTIINQNIKIIKKELNITTRNLNKADKALNKHYLLM